MLALERFDAIFQALRSFSFTSRVSSGRVVGKPEVNRDTMAFRGGLRVLTGFCYTLFFLVSLRTHIVIHIIIRAQCGPTTHFS